MFQGNQSFLLLSLLLYHLLEKTVSYTSLEFEAFFFWSLRFFFFFHGIFFFFKKKNFRFIQRYFWFCWFWTWRASNTTNVIIQISFDWDFVENTMKMGHKRLVILGVFFQKKKERRKKKKWIILIGKSFYHPILLPW